MKTKLSIFCFLVIFVIFSVPVSVPGAETNPNGFPSGPHFNLNIHGKKADSTCPPKEYYLRVTADNNSDGDLNALVKVCDPGSVDPYYPPDVCEPTTIQAYGNSIFIPLVTDPDKIAVYVESGKKGPKSAPDTEELEVTDWCSGFGDDAEVRFRIPKNDAGYDVYVRALAKPTDNPSMTFSDPGLVYAEDEDGGLVIVGYFDSSGFLTYDGPYTITRSKGKSTAQNITDLFTWSGDLCYTTTTGTDGRAATDFCWIDSNLNGARDQGDEYYEPTEETCPAGGEIVTLYCATYDDWVFNIADFVEMFYKTENDNSRLVQFRFYPR